MAFFGACAWIFARHAWREIDPQDPGKQFVREVAMTVRGDALRLVPAGSMLLQGWARFAGRRISVAGTVESTSREKTKNQAELARTAGNSLG